MGSPGNRKSQTDYFTGLRKSPLVEFSISRRHRPAQEFATQEGGIEPEEDDIHSSGEKNVVT